MPREHVVRQGECLVTIARRYGFNDYRTVYQHPDNEAFRQKRPNPNILHPGDVVVIPDAKAKSAPVSTGRNHRYRVVVPKKELHLELRDHESNPLANEPYLLEVDGETATEGTTDGNGRLRERVPVARDGAFLTIRERRLRLRFGHLDPMRNVPVEVVSGIQARLHNLGYNPGPADGVLGPRTRVALAVFQADEGVDITGEPDDPTLSKLEECHGC